MINGTTGDTESVNVEEVWDARSKVTLIHCYRDEPHIWNVNTVYRSDAERRQTLSEAWSRIQQRMSAMGYNFEVQQLKKKMKQLRDQFSRENKMFEDHSSKWQFYEEMSFLNQNEGSSFSAPFTNFQPAIINGVSPAKINDGSSYHVEGGGLFDGKANAADDQSLSLDVEVKYEEYDSDDLRTTFRPRHGSSAMVTSSGVILNEVVMDEFLKMVLARKNVLLNDAADEESKNRVWRQIHEVMHGLLQVVPSVDELKEVFRRRQLHIKNVIGNSAKADVFSALGFARYIQSIINKCLPETEFLARDRELGTLLLQKSFLPHEGAAAPCAKRPRLSASTNDWEDDSRPGTSNARQKDSGMVSSVENPTEASCRCYPNDECFRKSALELVKAQKEYFTMATDVQKEQMKLISSLGDVLNGIAEKFLPSAVDHD
ncbi:hypothetical protein Q1695_015158 [Nippostrongylus brasiliensis]|nr:hypothetical protein Q1695_015158 [Nippostrongylus brasiliensis]